ncbi:MAG: Gfo/Idh/MocA family oxidoreductase [Planctomycetota bacterium]
MNIGAVGIDSSHLPEFTRRFKELHDDGRTPCRVTRIFDAGNHRWEHPDGPEQSAKDVAGWRKTALDLGAEQVESMDELLDSVDGVMILAIDGHRHLELATPALSRGLPTYIDKPMTCSLDEAKQILAISRESGARAYSASSLRFPQEIQDIDLDKTGPIVAIDAFGNGELLDMMPHLWHYGCHSIEMVDAIFKRSGQGGGVGRVSAVAMEDRHLLDMAYRDGRYTRIRMDRRASWAFGATVHGEKGVDQFVVDFGPVYTRLIEGMAGFFAGGEAPAALRDLVENVAVMEAGNRSIEQDGGWVPVPEIA